MTPAKDRPVVALIAAVARNGVIGHDNALLWHVPEDLQFFRRTTAGCPVIMGRKTWDSLPDRFRPLPGRRNVIITRQDHFKPEGAETAPSVAAALTLLAQDPAPKVFVIGGAQIYAAALPEADELIFTELDCDFSGDAVFPAWDRSRFTEMRRESLRTAPPNDFDIHFVTYQRRH